MQEPTQNRRNDPRILRHMVESLAREVVRYHVALGDANETVEDVLLEAYVYAVEAIKP